MAVLGFEAHALDLEPLSDSRGHLYYLIAAFVVGVDVAAS